MGGELVCARVHVHLRAATCSPALALLGRQQRSELCVLILPLEHNGYIELPPEPVVEGGVESQVLLEHLEAPHARRRLCTFRFLILVRAKG
eukprot:scaffold142483_cov124-Phaeocystis_antarctica.AAC.1